MSATAAKILVIDDETEIQKFLQINLALHGYEHVGAELGEEGLRLCATEQPSLVILDIDLPDKNGVDIITAIREWSDVPIIVLSEEDDEKTIISALDAGADDYVSKPFQPGIFLARIRANMRCRTSAQAEENPVLSCGRLEVDLLRHSATLKGEVLDLTPKEFDLLAMFVRYSGRVLTHRFILEKIWGPAHTEDIEYVRVFVKQLREKIERDSTDPDWILTETGVGYRLENPLDEAV